MKTRFWTREHVVDLVWVVGFPIVVVGAMFFVAYLFATGRA